MSSTPAPQCLSARRAENFALLDLETSTPGRWPKVLQTGNTLGGAVKKRMEGICARKSPHYHVLGIHTSRLVGLHLLLVLHIQQPKANDH